MNTHHDAIVLEGDVRVLGVRRAGLGRIAVHVVAAFGAVESCVRRVRSSAFAETFTSIARAIRAPPIPSSQSNTTQRSVFS